MGAFDPAGVFKVVQSGGPPAIFLLLLFVSLLLTGVVRVKREVDAAELRWQEMKILNDQLLGKIERQQDLFERSLDLLERQVMPLLRTPPAPRR